MIEPYTSKVQMNLKKVRGQLNLIDKMIGDKRYCIDIAQQINAAIGLLKQANSSIFENHLLTCGTHKLNSKKEQERLNFSKELLKAFNLTNK
jgi:CsoR family transcriptional regulator, copper-sensing transcriptional repressor